jgi:hypothetical protein
MGFWHCKCVKYALYLKPWKQIKRQSWCYRKHSFTIHGGRITFKLSTKSTLNSSQCSAVSMFCATRVMADSQISLERRRHNASCSFCGLELRRRGRIGLQARVKQFMNHLTPWDNLIKDSAEFESLCFSPELKATLYSIQMSACARRH